MLAASASTDLSIAIWNPYTHELIKQIFQAHEYTIMCLLNLGSNYLASGADDNLINIWETLTYTFVRRLAGHKDNVYSIDILSNGNLVSGSLDKYVGIWNPSSGQLLGYYEPPFQTQVNSVKQLDNGLVAVVGNKKIMYLMNITNGVFQSSVNLTTSSASSYGLVSYNNGQILAAVFNGKAAVINTTTNSLITTYTGSGGTFYCVEHMPLGSI